MLVQAMLLMSPGNLVAADQKLLAGSDQDSRRGRLLDLGYMLKLGQEGVALLMARVDQKWHLTAAELVCNIVA